jgi:DNA-binding NarL/FixJ family response regulator
LTEAEGGLFSDVSFTLRLYTQVMINILLVEDDDNLRKGIRMRLELEPDFVISGETGDGSEALELAPRLKPNVIVMDLRLPGMDGLEATRQLRRLVPDSKVVILTLYDESANRQRGKESGAAAFVSKQEPHDALILAIREANRL